MHKIYRHYYGHIGLFPTGSIVLQNDMLDSICLLHKIYIDISLNIDGHIALFPTGSTTK